MKLKRRAWALAALVVGLLGVGAGAYVAYRAVNRPLPAAAQAVQDVLELRVERSSDASAYARYFVEPGVAQTLAQDATASVSASADTSARSPVPRWERPYLSKLASGTADVVVRWKRDTASKSWAIATVFTLQRRAGRWKIVDAQELTKAKSIPSELEASRPTSLP